jgi:hypothetical protein
MTAIPPTRKVSPRELRQIFNHERYAERVASGEFTTRIVREHHPTSPKAHVPFCTWSQKIAYLDRGEHEVATVHQYLQPDGSLGASGLPDPKRLLLNGVLYVAWEPLGRLGER